jgi:hypothetical protein
MGEVLPFVRRRQSAFDPDTVSVMGKAYDDAIATLSDNVGAEHHIRELIARRIVKMARSGDVDRERLYKWALSGFDRPRYRI